MRGELRCRGGSRYRFYRSRCAIMARRMDLYTLIKQIYVKPIVLVRIPNSQCRTHFLISERAEESCRAGCSECNKTRRRTKDSHGNLKREKRTRQTIARELRVVPFLLPLLLFSTRCKMHEMHDRSAPVNYHRHGFAYSDAGKGAISIVASFR